MQIHRYIIKPQNNQRPPGRYIRYTPEALPIEMDADIQTPAHGTYGGLLFDPRWKSKRNEIIERDKGCCIICNGSSELQVHHRQYQFVKAANAFKMPWDYADHLLITLCKNCHQRGHSKYKVPTLII